MSRKENNQNGSTKEKEREDCKTDQMKGNDPKSDNKIYANKSTKSDSASKDDNSDKNRNKNEGADNRNSNNREKKERV
jgi:hypothetical protein